VFVTASAASRFDALLVGVDVPVHPVTERAGKALSETVTPIGLVAVCEPVAVTLTDVVASQSRLVVVAVGVSEPGNAGTLIRLSHAMGAAAVVLAGHSVDPYNAKCLRASAGSVFAIPVVVEPDAMAAVTALRRAGLQILATMLDGEVCLDNADLSAPTAWVFGAEAHGLPAEVAVLADARVRIPMPGAAESLNVAAAAAICLYQSARAHR
jgi:RNA methyltransferase, TrmH family